MKYGKTKVNGEAQKILRPGDEAGTEEDVYVVSLKCCNCEQAYKTPIANPMCDVRNSILYPSKFRNLKQDFFLEHSLAYSVCERR